MLQKFAVETTLLIAVIFLIGMPELSSLNKTRQLLNTVVVAGM